MWYDNTTKSETKPMQVNMWWIRWDKERKVWMCGGLVKVEGSKDRKYIEEFCSPEKDDAIDYALTHISPTTQKAWKGNGGNAGALSGVRGKVQGGDFHSRLDKLTKSYRAAASKESRKARLARKIKENQNA